MMVESLGERRAGAATGWFRAVVTVVVLAGFVGVAQAQVELDDYSEPIDSADLATQEGQMLQQGLDYAAQENFLAASLIFYRLYADGTGTDTVVARAQYELAKTLYHLRLFYGALLYFDDIVAQGPDNPMFIPTYPWLLRLHRRLPGEQHMLERLAAYEDFFPDQILDKYRDHVAYLIGRYYYQNGLLEDAQSFLSFVSRGSRWFGEARFLEGTASIQQFQGQPAVDAFRDVIDWVLQSDERTPELRRLAELSVLSVARTFYSTGEYDKALRWYDQVPTSSRYWLDALFEKAWALFQEEEYNRSLGNLHSLNSPFFDDEFYPEGMILTAVIFFRNCNYDAVRETIEEFQFSYGPFMDQLEDFEATLGSDEEYYELVLDLTGEQERDFSARQQQILNAAIDSSVVRDALGLVQELERELAAIQSADPAWRNEDLGLELLTETELAQSVAAGAAGEVVRIRIDRARNQLQGLMNQGEAILVETDLIESTGVSADMRDELNLSDAGLRPPPLDDEHLLWHFAGEYWRDELGYYWYAIQSRCSEVGY